MVRNLALGLERTENESLHESAGGAGYPVAQGSYPHRELDGGRRIPTRDRLLLYGRPNEKRWCASRMDQDSRSRDCAGRIYWPRGAGNEHQQRKTIHRFCFVSQRAEHFWKQVPYTGAKWNEDRSQTRCWVCAG